ncbi:MAG: hypothetical protein EBW12_06760 [Actinobacteria bacterium]|jgi:hypothetical protein|nr:hypothetical protein [Actinomycetota bacterium]
MGAFDDGTPLDAAALQDLDRRLTEVKSSIPKIGQTVINNNTSVTEVKAKHIFGGLAPLTGKLTAGGRTGFSIEWKADSQPISVVITPMLAGGAKASLTVYVESMNQNGCKGYIYTAKGDTPPTNLGLQYLVICS